MKLITMKIYLKHNLFIYFTSTIIYKKTNIFKVKVKIERLQKLKINN